MPKYVPLAVVHQPPTEQVRSIVEEAGEAMRQELMPQLAELDDSFPPMVVGIQDATTEKEPYVLADSLDIKGVVVHRAFGTIERTVIVTPEGIYECQERLFKAGYSDKSDVYVNWSERQTSDLLWLEFSDHILDAMATI